MGQYFKAVNLDRHEYVCPWCVGGGAKFFEWIASPQGSVLSFLLRMSHETGGGDVPPQNFNLEPVCGPKPDEMYKSLMSTLIEDPHHNLRQVSVVGSWVGDRIALVGDYDSSELYNYARSFFNISEQLVAEWNTFIDLPEHQLRFERCESCGQD